MVGVLLFPIHQDIIISTIPLESMKSASQGLKSQSCSLLTSTNYCREKNVSFNYIFFLDWICLFAFWRKGRSFRSFLSSGDEVMKQLLHLIMNGSNRIRRLFRLPSWYFLSSIIWCICEAIGSLLWSLLFYFVCIFLASMHLLREGQMG
jgi:hypothetical protein